jgi:hypothetical protein
MEHLKNTVASLLGMVFVFGLMTFLAISAYINRPIFPSDACNRLVQCDINLHQSLQFDADKVPTLAPPRNQNALSKADNSLRASLLGQPVYIQVRTDHSEIEVGWATGESFGR